MDVRQVAASHGAIPKLRGGAGVSERGCLSLEEEGTEIELFFGQL
jgi:hypothetical protein